MIEYTQIPYNTTTIREVILPKGEGNKGNLCYLFTKNFDQSIELMVGPNNCNARGKYRL